MDRPVPYVSDAAVVRGVAAWVLTRALARSLGEVVEGLPPASRDEALAAFKAIRRAGEAWQARASSANGTPERVDAELSACSPHDEIGTDDAAGMLDVSPRWARTLGERHGLGRKVGSRWVFSRGAVLAYIEEGQAA